MIHIIRLLSLTFLMLTASCEHETLLVENPERETVSEERYRLKSLPVSTHIDFRRQEDWKMRKPLAKPRGYLCLREQAEMPG